MTVTVSPDHEGLLLRDYLRRQASISRAMLTRLKNDPAGILLNGQHVTVRAILHAGDLLELAAAVSGMVAGIGLLLVAICRLMGKKPSFLCHSALSIFFALQLISQYRRWSADPQLMDYCFYLIALICLMITGYFMASFEAEMRSPRALLFFSMAATFFCLLALPESGDAPMLIACALWAFTCSPQMQTKTPILKTKD